MTKSFFLILLGCLFFCCNKSESEPRYLLTDLIISKTETQDTTTLLQGITVNVRAHGPDLCYRFSHFDIRQKTTFEYDIFTKGTVPSRNPICLQAIYDVDTSLTIRPTITGKYIIRYQNSAAGTYYLSDTVQVD